MNSLSDFRFANPEWSLLLAGIVAFLFLVIYLNRRKSSLLNRFLYYDLQNRLVIKLSDRKQRMVTVCLGLSAACLVVALMRPQWGTGYQKQTRKGAYVMVCLDVSKSMLAEDSIPNRLERAKSEIVDLLGYLEGDQVGLIAFAGAARVMCPLTGDFGFFRLILKETSVASVGRGGSRLEEPIRKAVNGFEQQTDVSRIILLITDGEDHDSHPLDAARLAAERGIRLITIGFGDEAGSPVRVRNSESGVMTTLLDAQGAPVITRLDGVLLREMAQMTEGAYVPAGTGALDLQSIYDAHIAPLIRGQLDQQRQIVRREGFQWPVLFGILFFMVAILSDMWVKKDTRSNVSRRFSKKGVVASLIICTICDLTLSASYASTTAQKTSQSKVTDTSERDETQRDNADPRITYNQAIDHLEGDPDQAEELLRVSRSEAGADATVRFSATYNMGWLQAERGEKNLASDPESALAHYRQSADWFQQSVRMRPNHENSRVNLEIVLRQVMLIEDSLKQTKEETLEAGLDRIIESQRAIVLSTGTLADMPKQDDDNSTRSRARSAFRTLSIEQRMNLAEGQQMFRRAYSERETIVSNSSEATVEERLRQHQLTEVKADISRGNQFMGQARSQMRRGQGIRAFRRAASALQFYKQARNRLRNPLDRLSQLVIESEELLQLLIRKRTPEEPVDAKAGALRKTPVWLTLQYLMERYQSFKERTEKLHDDWDTVIQSDEGQGAPDVANADSSNETKALQVFVQRLKSAQPFLAEANTCFSRTDQLLKVEPWNSVVDTHRDGILMLREAREQFMDVRTLIEQTYAQQMTISEMMVGGDEPAESDVDKEVTLIRSAIQIQKRNISRARRVRALLDEQSKMGNIESTPDSDSIRYTENQIAEANRLLEHIEEEMNLLVHHTQQLLEAYDSLNVMELSSRRDSINSTMSVIVDYLQRLRRIFFSAVEHLRETIQYQSQLIDDTEKSMILSESTDTQKVLGPLVHRQQQLQRQTFAIANALTEQSEKGPPSDGEDTSEVHEITEKLIKAAGLVKEAEQNMGQAVGQLEDSMNGKDALGSQGMANEKLQQALTTLVPPESQNKQDQQSSHRQSPQQSDQGTGDQERQGDEGGSMQRLLQMIRDNEAKRQRDRNQKQVKTQQSADKDW